MSTFFYKGNHKAGANFNYNTELKELSIVITHEINFDNDKEGLHLKKLDSIKTYKTLSNIVASKIEEGCNTLLELMDSEYNSIFNF